MTVPPLHHFLPGPALTGLIQQALREDLGQPPRDFSSELIIQGERQALARFRARQPGRLCGAALLPLVIQAHDRRIALDPQLEDGRPLEAGSVIAQVRGPLIAILAIERVALNFLTLLSGVASLTARYVAACAGTKARIYDTRKTIPGLRALQKYAVVCGGGANHRMGLFDAVLIKDNHLAHISLAELPRALAGLVAQARAQPQVRFVEIEVDCLEQLPPALASGCDIVLLDNMTIAQLQQAVALRDQMDPRVQLEASGGVNLETVAAIAASGVDRIAVGALTHSAPALDIGLDIP